MKLYELIADVIRNYKPVSIDKLREWELLARDIHTEMAGMVLMDAEAAIFAEGKVLIDESTYEAIIEKSEEIEAKLERVIEKAKTINPMQIVMNAMASYFEECEEDGVGATKTTVAELIGYLKMKQVEESRK